MISETENQNVDQEQQQQEKVEETNVETNTESTDNNVPPLPFPSTIVSGWVEPTSLEEKRKLYACGDKYVTIDSIIPYPEYAIKNKLEQPKVEIIKKVFKKYFITEHNLLDKDHFVCNHGYFPYNEEINKKISIWRGDSCTLEIDAIVNAANESLLGGGGIDGAIHRAAGSALRKYNANLQGCDTGDTKISPGFKLPAKYILHTVGPVGEVPTLLKSSYETTLALVEKYKIKTVALCGVSTGIFGYPLDKATMIAMHTVRQWLEKNHDKVDRIIFVTFLPREVDMYNTVAPYFFPIKELNEEEKKE
ncbi:hypothetical protein ABK040_000075 [Willaertia magna]